MDASSVGTQPDPDRSDASDNVSSRDAPAAPPAPVQEPPRIIMGVPLDAFVRGGTRTYASEMQEKAAEADAEHRRDVAAHERRLASTPIEEGGAKLFTNRMTSAPEAQQAYVLLKYLHRSGEPMYDHGQPVECLADVTIVGPSELALIIVCPRCKENGTPSGQCQMRIRQSNKRWELDTRTAGELIIFEGRPYRSAGRVRECERFTCGNCSFSARIDDNKLRAE